MLPLTRSDSFPLRKQLDLTLGTKPVGLPRDLAVRVTGEPTASQCPRATAHRLTLTPVATWEAL